jgi:hypothetical protein
VSPIFVRPVREQLEHDRLIRFLQNKYKRKFEVAINVGDEQAAPVKLGTQTFFPDLVLTDGRRMAGLVEVETGESVNNLEAMAQWVHFSRARVPFHLYVPVAGYDAARRLCEQNGVVVGELWTYRASLDGFDLVRVFHDAAAAAREARKAPKAAATLAPAPAPRAASEKAARPKTAKPAPKAPAAKPALKVSRTARRAKPSRPGKSTSARPASRGSRKPARQKKAAAGKR